MAVQKKSNKPNFGDVEFIANFAELKMAQYICVPTSFEYVFEPNERLLPIMCKEDIEYFTKGRTAKFFKVHKPKNPNTYEFPVERREYVAGESGIGDDAELEGNEMAAPKPKRRARK